MAHHIDERERVKVDFVWPEVALLTEEEFDGKERPSITRKKRGQEEKSHKKWESDDPGPVR
jgi:hypothetical protein